MTEDRIKFIRDVIWTKYIDFGHADEMEEEEALTALEEYHRTHTVAVDGETYYLGILYFELSWAQDDDVQRLYLARAAELLERYRVRSGEADWEPLTDRIEEARGVLAELSAEELAALEKQVREELDETDEAAESTTDIDAPFRIEEGMVYVPGGTYLAGEAKAPRETKAFWIDLYPVTNADYERFVKHTGYRSPKFWQEGRLKEPEAPVVGVSWYDAYKYAAFAGKSLPAKDQWEKAARGSRGNLYPWGDELGDEQSANYSHEDNGEAQLTDVGTFPANRSEYGVCDMVGNVWEWTESQDPTDPEQRIICGGSWCDDADFLRCDVHLAAYPKDKYDNIGFRCVRIAAD